MKPRERRRFHGVRELRRLLTAAIDLALCLTEATIPAGISGNRIVCKRISLIDGFKMGHREFNRCAGMGKRVTSMESGNGKIHLQSPAQKLSIMKLPVSVAIVATACLMLPLAIAATSDAADTN